MITLIRLQLRRLRYERLAALSLAVLVFVTALLLAIGPRLLERISNEALVSELQAAKPVERDLIVFESSRPSADVPDTLDDAKARQHKLAEQLPAQVQALVSDQHLVADSTSWEVLSGTQFQSLLFLRVEQNVAQHVELIDGRLPTGRTTIAPDPRPNSIPTQRATMYEVMLSEPTAKEMGVTVGQDVPLVLSQLDRRNSGVDLTAIARIVGIYRVTNPDDPFWLADDLVLGFRFHPVGTNTVYVESDAILADDAYGALQHNARNNRLPLSFQWRYDLDVSRVDANRADELETALRRLDANPPRSGVSDVPTDTQMRNGLPRLLQAHQARWESATALLAIVGIGALFVAATCLALVALLASAGRRGSSALVLARGAGTRRVRAALGAEGLLISVPAALLALLVAIVLAPAAGWWVSVAAAVLVVLVATGLLVATGVPAGGAAAARGGGQTLVPRGRRLSARQLVVEGALVVGAIAAAVVLRERGVAGVVGAAGPTTAGASTVSADPLMVAVPALVGVAAGVFALRLYPLLTAIAARLAGWQRGLVLPLASRRAARGRSSTAVLVTLIATASVAGFAVAGWTTLDQAATNAGWQRVGAPFLLTSNSGTLPADFDATAVAGVTRVAPAWRRAGVIGQQTPALMALDTTAYQQITAGTPADAHLPAELFGALGAGADAVPAIASDGLGLRVGSRAAVGVGSKTVSVTVVGTVAAFPLSDADKPFVLVAHDQLTQLAPDILGSQPPFAIFIDAPSSAGPALESLAAANPDLQLRSASAAAATLAQTPISRAVSFGLAVSAFAAAAYAGLAVAAAFVLAAADQRQETAYLRVLGLSRRQRLRLVFSEHVPAALAAALAGGVLGIFVFAFVRPALGLASVLPESANVELSINPIEVLALLGAALLIVLPAWALAAFAQREPNTAAAVRESGA